MAVDRPLGRGDQGLPYIYFTEKQNSLNLSRSLSTEAFLKTFVTTNFWPGVNLHIIGPDMHISFETQQES